MRKIFKKRYVALKDINQEENTDPENIGRFKPGYPSPEILSDSDLFSTGQVVGGKWECQNKPTDHKENVNAKETSVSQKIGKCIPPGIDKIDSGISLKPLI